MSEEKKSNSYELNDEKLENVAGGAGVQLMSIACPHCGTINTINVCNDSFKCKKCHLETKISG